MGSLLAVVLVAALVFAVTVLGYPPSWSSWVTDRVAGWPVLDAGGRTPAAGDEPEPAEAVVEWDVLTQPFVHRRLDALAREIERLDRDPDVFAKAFHTMAARSAQEALLADASRLADRSAFCAGQPFDLELTAPSAALREEMEL
jgi:hypothetical protein